MVMEGRGEGHGGAELKTKRKNPTLMGSSKFMYMHESIWNEIK